MGKISKTQILVECAVMLGLGIVLSVYPKFDSLWNMGGSITVLSMLPVCLISMKHGFKWGFGTAFLFSVSQLLFGLKNLTYAQTALVAAAIVLLDYIIPFTGLGFAGIFRRKSAGWQISGIFLVLFFRFICHYISGVFVWGQWTESSAWIYSLTYNGSYMLPESVFTMAGAAFLLNMPYVRKMFRPVQT